MCVVSAHAVLFPFPHGQPVGQAAAAMISSSLLSGMVFTSCESMVSSFAKIAAITSPSLTGSDMIAFRVRCFRLRILCRLFRRFRCG